MPQISNIMIRYNNNTGLPPRGGIPPLGPAEATCGLPPGATLARRAPPPCSSSSFSSSSFPLLLLLLLLPFPRPTPLFLLLHAQSSGPAPSDSPCTSSEIRCPFCSAGLRNPAEGARDMSGF